MQPILFDFPTEILTDRLLIRMPHYHDGKQIYESITASREELSKYLPFAGEETSEEEVEEECRNAHIRFLQRTELRMYIFEKETGKFIGSSGFHDVNWKVPRFEIGYWLDSRYTGQGYMTEAIEALTDYAFRELKAKRVTIKCDATNLKSRAVAERLGYALEGTIKNDAWSVDKTRLTDTLIFAKTV